MQVVRQLQVCERGRLLTKPVLGISARSGWAGSMSAEAIMPASDIHTDGLVTTESWSEADQRIRVTQPAGFLFNLELNAKVDAPPDDVYAILTDPGSHKIFRGIKSVLYRKVLADDGAGRRQLEVGHRATTKFLFISVSFDTRLFVDEDDNQRTITFRLAKKGFMKDFSGTWNVRPFNQHTLDTVFNSPAADDASPSGPSSSSRQWFNPIAAIASTQHGHSRRCPSEASSSLVTLDQAILPRATPPAAMTKIVRGLCGHQLRVLMEDLRTEVQRRQQQAAGGTDGQGTSDHHHGTSVKQLPLSSTRPLACMSMSRDLFANWSSPIEISVRL